MQDKLKEAPKCHPADYPCNKDRKYSDYLNCQWTGEKKATAKERHVHAMALDCRRRELGKYRPGLLR